MIIRLCFVIATTVIALAISDRTKKQQRHEQESPEETERSSCERRDEEMVRVGFLAKELRKRKSALEKRLLELHDAKEEYRMMVHLRKRLSAKCSEVESLEKKVRELWSERNVLEDELRKSGNEEEELVSARSVITGLQEWIESRKKGMGEMVRTVEERVDIVRRNDGKCHAGKRNGNEEEDQNNVKLEVLELQRTNKELELDRRELASKLDAARTKIRCLLSRIEDERETIAELKKESRSLRRANEELQKHVDHLQKKRFGIVEELVYTRWLNICLRFEVEDFYEISRKNPTTWPRCDYRREWSSEYIEKTGRLLRAASNGLDPSPTATPTAESSSSSGNKKKHQTLIHRIKSWGKGKKNSNEDSSFPLDEHTTAGGRRIRSRRHSTSMIPEPRDAKYFSRLRRVSFDDAVRTSVPLFESSTMTTKSIAVAEVPNVSTSKTETSDCGHTSVQEPNLDQEMVSTRVEETSECSNASVQEPNLDQEMVSTQVEETSECSNASVQEPKLDQEMVRAVTGGEISKMCMVVVFLVFILIITFNYHVF